MLDVCLFDHFGSIVRKPTSQRFASLCRLALLLREDLASGGLQGLEGLPCSKSKALQPNKCAKFQIHLTN